MLLYRKVNSVSTWFWLLTYSANISVTRGEILRFFAPQGRQVALIKVKFGADERLHHAKFHQLVSSSLTSPLSTNMAISETKRSGVDSYPYPVKEGQRYINLNPGRLFVQQPLKRERDREAHLNYYVSAYNRGTQLSHRKTKLNQIRQNTRINLN